MKLTRLSLENFKGARSVVIEPNGKDWIVYGDNAVGKTTLADAWFWLLFGKDSHNSSDFEIKTINSDGETLHRLNHSVEAEIELPSGTLTLKRTYREVYTKKRGALNDEFTGHTTDYHVNGVPVQKSEYDRQIAAVCDEKRFRLLTDPNFFCATMTWQDRRKALVALCGDISDVDVIASSDELAGIPTILDGRSVDDAKKVLQAKRKAMNEEIASIPVRIDELTKALPDEQKCSDQDRDELTTALTKLQEHRAELSAGGEIAELNIQLKSVESDMAAVCAAAKLVGDSPERESALALARNLVNEITEKEFAVNQIVRQMDSTELDLRQVQTNYDRAKEALAGETARVYIGDSNCPSCGQALPEDRIAAAVEAFNTTKAKNRESIITSGKAIRAQLDGLKATLAKLAEDKASAEIELDAKRAERSALVVPEIRVVDPYTSPEYQKLASEKQRVLSLLDSARSGANAAVLEVDKSIAIIKQGLLDLERRRLQNEQRANSLKRIKELELSHKGIASAYEQTERDLYLIEQFIRAKVSLLTDRINSRFAFVTFRLFDEQVNGGLSECCEAMRDGVPFTSLNHGSRLNVGLDIINAFAAKFNFAPPIWIDNAESVTSIIPTSGQQIRLIVSATDSKLRSVPAQQEALV